MVALSKCDAALPDDIAACRSALADAGAGDVHEISAVAGDGMTEVLRLLGDAIDADKAEESAAETEA